MPKLAAKLRRKNTMIKIQPSIEIALLLGMAMFVNGQTIPTVHQTASRSSCSNIVALSGAKVDCSHLTPAQKKAMENIPAILKMTIENQNYLDAIMQKLADMSGPQQPAVNIAPGGFAVSGGTVVNPAVNNFAPQPHISWTQNQIEAKDGKGQTKIVLTVDHLVELPAFGITCDIPCSVIDVSMQATGMFSLQGIFASPNPTIAGFELAAPRPLGPGIPIVVWVLSADQRTPNIQNVGFIPPEAIPSPPKPQ
jgi:hypothetical protein